MPVEVRVDPGVITRMLRRRGGTAERKLRERTRRVARIAEVEAPGSIGAGIEWDVESGRSGLEGVVVSTHEASRFVLDGTRPHLIRPRRKKALRFQAGGGVVFAKLVRHPGTKANNYLLRALRRGR
ncbi:hypothetical protein [Streptomyces sp. NPDC057250]|uniref:hypothetical protein n=1 Tax=Streptomyces sp. NPDC057250 TaxID=3346068 RepID=UPI003626325C